MPASIIKERDMQIICKLSRLIRKNISISKTQYAENSHLTWSTWTVLGIPISVAVIDTGQKLEWSQAPGLLYFQFLSEVQWHYLPVYWCFRTDFQFVCLFNCFYSLVLSYFCFVLVFPAFDFEGDRENIKLISSRLGGRENLWEVGEGESTWSKYILWKKLKI